MFEFWQRQNKSGDEINKNIIQIKPSKISLQYPLIIKKYGPPFYIQFKELLDKYYIVKYGEKYHFNYEVTWEFIKKNINDQIDEITSNNSNWDKVDQQIKDTYNEAEKIFDEYNEKNKYVDLSNYIIEYPIFLIKYDVHSARTLLKVKNYHTDETDKIKDSIIKLFEFVDIINEYGFGINKIPEDGVIFPKGKNSEVICFFPENFIYPNKRSDVYKSSQDAIVNYIKKLKSKKENFNTLNKNIDEICARIKSDKHFKNFSSFKRFFNENKKKKIELMAFVDWPNVDRAIFKLDIDWIELLNYISNKIFDDLEKAKENFTALEFKKIIFFRYQRKKYSSTYRKEKAEKDKEKVDNIIDVIKKESMLQPDLEQIDGESKEENQAVDKKIIERIKKNLVNRKKLPILILFTSDSDYFSVIQDYLKKERVYIVSFGDVANIYLKYEKDYHNFLNIIELEKLFNFIKT